MTEAHPPKHFTRHELAQIATCVLVLNLLFIAIYRRLNFDESLALHAGWLAVQSIEARPPFLMPITWLIGSLSDAILDPGTLFATLRLTVTATVLVALGWAVRSAALGTGGALLAAAFVLTNGAFIAHGIEFRYDWAIVLGWLAGYALLVGGGRYAPLLLGFTVFWLASHHVKGVWFAGFLYLFALFRYGLPRAPQRSALLQMHAGIGAAMAIWIAAVGLAGLLGEWIGVYVEFFTLGIASDRFPWLQGLGPRLFRDFGWWSFATVGAVLALTRSVARPQEYWAVAFAGVGLGFTFVHPHPWDYMLVPVVPFVALLATRGWHAVYQLVARPVIHNALVVGAALLLAPSLVGALNISILAPRDDQVDALRLIRQHARPADTVLDPSGLAYFLPPVAPEWYFDTLYQHELEQGRWMQDLANVAPRADWVVNTYRVGWFPSAAIDALGREHAHVCYGLLLRRSDPRGPVLAAQCKSRTYSIASFWGTWRVINASERTTIQAGRESRP